MKTKIHGNKGKKHPPITEEHREKLREAMRKRIRLTGSAVSTEARKKLSESHKGNKSHFWKGGVWEGNNKVRKSFEYKLWREAVFKRDKYQCIWGGKEHGNKLNADHILSFASHPELRFAIDNGRTLCEECHKTTPSYRNRYFKD